MPKPDERALLALVMIVKNEAQSIRATIESVRDVVDHYTILDTGSTDETISIIQSAFGGVPGMVHQGQFTDYSTTRNLALGLAEDEAQFCLMLSGDETLRDAGELRAWLEERAAGGDGGYFCKVILGDDHFASTRISRSGARWRYTGVTHEAMTGPKGESPSETAPATIFHDVSRRSLPEQRRRWIRDVALLRQQVEDDPRDARATFYLAQSYECLGEHETALRWYELRFRLPGWEGESYECLWRIARVLGFLDRPWAERQEAYLQAYDYAPHRAEPLIELGRLFLERSQPHRAYLVLIRACQIAFPEHELAFVQAHLYKERWVLCARAALEAGHEMHAHAVAKTGTMLHSDDQDLIERLSEYLPLEGGADIDALRERLGETKVVVSLSTIPSRVNLLLRTLRTIEAQRLAPDEIILCLPHFSEREQAPYEVPEGLSDLVRVVRCEDYGPGTKLLGALSAGLPDDTIIVTIDDDIDYEEHVLEKLVESALAHPDAAIGFSGWNVERLLYENEFELAYEEKGGIPLGERRVNILEGYRGVAYRRSFFAAGIESLYELSHDAFFVDDVWISGYLAQRGVPKIVRRFGPGRLTEYQTWHQVWRQHGLEHDSNPLHLLTGFRRMNRKTALAFELGAPGIWRREVIPSFSETTLTMEQQLQRERPLRYMQVAARLIGDPPKTVIEVGSIRYALEHDLLDTDHACCNDGHSTYVWANHRHRIYTVDVDQTNTELVRRELPFVRAFTGDGIEFLRDFAEEIDLLFLDAWDVIEGEPYAERHLEAFEAARPKLASKHLVVIDDTDIADGGKGRLLVPHLQRLGYHLLAKGRQTIMSNYPIDPTEVERVFADCYRGPWQGISGPGSAPEYTALYREYLQKFMADHQVENVLDLGCGDWSFSQMVEWPASYVGVDVVRHVVLENQRRFRQPNLTFLHADAMDFPFDAPLDDLNAPDLLILKDVMQHWPNDEVKAFLDRLELLRRNHPDRAPRFALFVNCITGASGLNGDIGTGGFRPLDLNAKPFDAGLERVLDFHTKAVMLWRRDPA